MVALVPKLEDLDSQEYDKGLNGFILLLRFAACLQSGKVAHGNFSAASEDTAH